MKLNIHAGHGASNSKSQGAVGLINESTEARKVKDEVIRLLKSEGHAVFDCTVDYPNDANDCLKKIVNNCNKYKVDLDISIHFNSGASDRAGNGKSTGVEVFSYDTRGIAFDTSFRICDKVSKLGFKNRGPKVNKSLYVLKNTISPAILIECCFVDDKDDINLYNYKTMAKAIVEGILNKNINTNENKGDYDMNKLVTYLGDADLFAATIVSQKHGCPLMKKSDFDKSGLKVKEVIQIGGKKEDIDRFTTFKNACKYL